MSKPESISLLWVLRLFLPPVLSPDFPQSCTTSCKMKETVPLQIAFDHGVYHNRTLSKIDFSCHSHLFPIPLFNTLLSCFVSLLSSVASSHLLLLLFLLLLFLRFNMFLWPSSLLCLYLSLPSLLSLFVICLLILY